MAQHNLTDTITFRRGLTSLTALPWSDAKSICIRGVAMQVMIRSVITIIVLRPQAY